MEVGVSARLVLISRHRKTEVCGERQGSCASQASGLALGAAVALIVLVRWPPRVWICSPRGLRLSGGGIPSQSLRTPVVVDAALLRRFLRRLEWRRFRLVFLSANCAWNGLLRRGLGGRPPYSSSIPPCTALPVASCRSADRSGGLVPALQSFFPSGNSAYERPAVRGRSNHDARAAAIMAAVRQMFAIRRGYSCAPWTTRLFGHLVFVHRADLRNGIFYAARVRVERSYGVDGSDRAGALFAMGSDSAGNSSPALSVRTLHRLRRLAPATMSGPTRSASLLFGTRTPSARRKLLGPA